VIDTGFPIGGMNQANLKLIFQAKSLGKMIISLRNPADALSGYNELGAVMVTSLPELIERINQTISSN
jgi:hypothetical protein